MGTFTEELSFGNYKVGIWDEPPSYRTIRLEAATLALDFTDGSLGNQLTFTRGSSAAYFDSAGVRQLATTNTPRFDHDPATLQAKGLLIEEGRTNLVLNSLIDGTSLGTQSVTVTAVAHTLSFYGTGTVTLSGASAAGPLVGTGATNRVSLTFTPSAGSLTLTVSGSVKWGQLEVGSFMTSHIPTAGAAVARSNDVAQFTAGANMAWFNGTAGTFVVEFDTTGPNTFGRVIGSSTAGAPSWPNLGGAVTTIGVYDGVTPLDKLVGGASTFTGVKAAVAYSATGRSITMQGAAASSDANVQPSPTVIYLGCHGGSGNFLNGRIKSLTFYPTRLSDDQLQALTAA